MPPSPTSDTSPPDATTYTLLPTPSLPFPPKPPIPISHYTPTRPLLPTPGPLIFSHGAGGTKDSPAITNFRAGYAPHASFLAFNGTMHLGSRVKMINAIAASLPEEPAPVLGGRSMGARAAVVCANERPERDKEGGEVPVLVLVSYPLHTVKHGVLEVRDQILRDVRPGTKVLFMIGERDSMCEMRRLEELRRELKCQTWVVLVRGANHGMEVRPARGTEGVGEMTGRVAAEWVCGREEGEKVGREGVIAWDDEEGVATWSGWMEGLPVAEEGDGEEGDGAAGEEEEQDGAEAVQASPPKKRGQERKEERQKRKKPAENSTPVEPSEAKEPKKNTSQRKRKDADGSVSTRTRASTRTSES